MTKEATLCFQSNVVLDSEPQITESWIARRLISPSTRTAISAAVKAIALLDPSRSLALPLHFGVAFHLSAEVRVYIHIT